MLGFYFSLTSSIALTTKVLKLSPYLSSQVVYSLKGRGQTAHFLYQIPKYYVWHFTDCQKWMVGWRDRCVGG